MTGKLDQSLDSILAANKKANTGRGRNRPAGRRGAVAGKRAKTSAPVGGVKKNTKSAKKNDKPAVPTGPAKTESKILVSNMPSDVNDVQIKEYFNKVVGSVKRANVSYGPTGQSRGIATIIFGKADAASKAFNDLNNVMVDGRPMKIEVILDGKDAPAPKQPKKLADRITQPKSAAKPKPANDTKGAKAGGRSVRGAKNNGRKPGRAKKTAEQLDAEMTDYFHQGTEPSAANGTTQAAVDTAMDDDI